MKESLTILLPGNPSKEFACLIEALVKDYKVEWILELSEIGFLQDKKILWAIELDADGFNLSMEKMLQTIVHMGSEALKGSMSAIIIQSNTELWTKNTVHRIIFHMNQLGCQFMGHPVVEAVYGLRNFLTWQKQMKLPLTEIYRGKCHELISRLLTEKKHSIKEPGILVLFSNTHKESNTMILWHMLKEKFPLFLLEKLLEMHLENGTIVDCRGCLYKTCIHYSEKKSCFYGGVIVQETLPAIEKADVIIWLCPNYNDAVSAKMMAVINRLTVLYKRVCFYQKTIYAIVVSGNSGGENVAMQLIGALNVNKGFRLPSYFALFAIANDPGAINEVPEIKEKVGWFANRIRDEFKTYEKRLRK